MSLLLLFTPVQGIAQINLADCDGPSELQLRWYSVQVFTSPEPPRARESVRAGEGSAWDPARAAPGKTVHGPGLRSRPLLLPDFETGFYWGRSFLRSIHVDLVLKHSGDEEAESQGK